MFKTYDGKAKIPLLEEEVLAYWEEQKIFDKSLALRKGKPLYIFYEGPPTANGKPGIHHVLSRAIKDIVCRYKTMKGFQVPRRAGWDTHGLPVEIAVEKMLGLTQKNEIESIGIAKFNKACRDLVEEHINMPDGWRKLTNRMGYWLDLDNAYITYKNQYIESVWWAIKTIFDKGLIYRGFKIVPQSPTIETPLSTHELSLGYRDVKDPNCYIKVKVLDSPLETIRDSELLIWTTTPWTLISNVAAAVGEDIDYVKVRNVRVIKQGDQKSEISHLLVLAEARLSALDGDVEILDRFKGSQIIGTRYQQIFDYLKIDRQQFPAALTLLPGNFVSTDNGSGIVHMAPAFGQDDYDMSRLHNLPVLQPVTAGGKFVEGIGPFSNRPVKTFTYADGHVEEGVDTDVVIALKTMDKIYRSTNDYVHSYPHCWRTDNPVIYFARESWFINSPEYGQRMIDINKTINWQPPEIGSGRFGNWLEDVKEWSLSRDRYWGTPLPVWISEDGEDMFAVGSIEELQQGLYEEDNGTRVPMSKMSKKLDLHRPFVDHIVFEKNGKTYRRTPEIIDVWFDSGAMPFAQLHYPFENKELFEESFPADFIAEGVDQTRGWFYTLHNIATVLFDKPAFKNIIVNDLILDKNGQKMSKSKGNVVFPFEVIDNYGVDPLRWYLITMNNPWIPKKFDLSGIEEVSRKMFDTLMNTYSFFALYANIDQFKPGNEQIPYADRPEVDRWILSRLYSLLDQVQEEMENYNLTHAARPIGDFVVDDLSNWYVRRNRRRFWKSEAGRDKQAAYQTLYEVLQTLSKMLAPFTPFVSETLYQNLKTSSMPASVHLADYPKLSKDQRAVQDHLLESKMKTVQTVVSATRALRNDSRIKVRQPLQTLTVSCPDSDKLDAIREMADIIREEINVKEVLADSQLGSRIKRFAKPDFKKLGPRFGKQMKTVAQLVQAFTQEEINSLEASQSINIVIDGQEQTIARDEVTLIDQQPDGLAIAREGNLAIALDTTLNEHLIREGIAREFVNRIQNLRKEVKLDVTDRISIHFQAPEVVANAVKTLDQYIRDETLAVEIIHDSPTAGKGSSTEIDEHEVQLLVNKV